MLFSWNGTSIHQQSKEEGGWGLKRCTSGSQGAGNRKRGQSIGSGWSIWSEEGEDAGHSRGLTDRYRAGGGGVQGRDGEPTSQGDGNDPAGIGRAKDQGVVEGREEPNEAMAGK